MKIKTRAIGLIIGVIMLIVGFVTPIQAEENQDLPEGSTTIMNVSLDATIYRTGDGELYVMLYIGESDVLGEMQAGIDNLEDNVNTLAGNDATLNNKIEKAQVSADSAYGIASNAYLQALNNKGLIDENTKALIMQYDQINDTIGKVWILRNELVAFEGHYFEFVNTTNSDLNDLQFGHISHDEELLLQGEDIEALQAKLNNINGVIALVRNTLIGLGILAFGLFLFNRKYPFGQIARNGKNLFRNGKQHTIVDFVPKAKKAKPHYSMLYMLTHIRRRNGHKTYHIRRNPQKSPLQFMFSFFHKL